ncbi:MAG: deoxyribonuclease IV, partial [Chlamydiae bacterium]|nr:deoxyribonuclease IV [Chlamydiota bacterium]
MKQHAPPLLLGAHTSTAGGLHHALLEGKDIGATTVQLFTRNQRQWVSKPLQEEEVSLFQQTLQKTGLSHIMSHSSYLINLGCPHTENLQKSRKAFKEEIIRCQQLGITYLNFHPGAALEAPVEQCLQTIIESLEEVAPLVQTGTTRLLLETTAGQGSVVGHTFEQLACLLEPLHKKMALGICIDTCHIFAAGYDLRTKQAL